jgi:hypothetical protein
MRLPDNESEETRGSNGFLATELVHFELETTILASRRADRENVPPSFAAPDKGKPLRRLHHPRAIVPWHAAVGSARRCGRNSLLYVDQAEALLFSATLLERTANLRRPSELQPFTQ